MSIACVSCPAPQPSRRRCARGCNAVDVVLFDGTLFSDDEMITSGTGTKTGRPWGTCRSTGRDGSLAALAGLPSGLGKRRITSTSTTPIRSDRRSPQRQRVEPPAAGRRSTEWE